MIIGFHNREDRGLWPRLVSGSYRDTTRRYNPEDLQLKGILKPSELQGPEFYVLGAYIASKHNHPFNSVRKLAM